MDPFNRMLREEGGSTVWGNEYGEVYKEPVATYLARQTVMAEVRRQLQLDREQAIAAASTNQCTAINF